MAVRIAVNLTGPGGQSIKEWARGLGRQGAIATTAAVGAAAEALKLDMRAHVRTIERGGGRRGFGNRLPNAIGSNLYPRKGKYSFAAAGMVFARGDKAAQIFRAWSEGAVIKGRNGNWLAIPMPYTPRVGRAAPTPESVALHFGRPLKLEYRRTRRGLVPVLVIEGVTPARSRKRPGLRKATPGRRRQGRAAQSVIMFTLIREAHIPKLLNFDALAAKRAAEIPALIQSALDAA